MGKFQAGNKIGTANRGRKRPDVSERMLKWNAEHPLKGVPKSPEHAAKLREAIKKANAARRVQAFHLISNHDYEALTGDCCICGKVPLKVSNFQDGSKQYSCHVGNMRGARVSYPGEAMDKWAGCCAICKCEIRRNVKKSEGQAVLDHDHATGKIRQAVLDHDHATGKMRGWLCHDCNLGLGHFRDNPETLTLAATYLTTRQNYKNGGL